MIQLKLDNVVLEGVCSICGNTRKESYRTYQIREDNKLLALGNVCKKDECNIRYNMFLYLYLIVGLDYHTAFKKALGYSLEMVDKFKLYNALWHSFKKR